MQSKSIAVIVVLSLVVVTLLVSGCTVITPSTSSPTPTPTVTTPTQTPITDQSSALTKAFESSTAIMERPFTKSTNERGNDVYKGVGRNATLPGANSVTVVVEFTKSQAEAKAVYDNAVATKGQEGYVYSADLAAYHKANNCKYCTGVWASYKGTQIFTCDYQYASQFSSWIVTTEAFVNT